MWSIGIVSKFIRKLCIFQILYSYIFQDCCHLVSIGSSHVHASLSCNFQGISTITAINFAPASSRSSISSFPLSLYNFGNLNRSFNIMISRKQSSSSHPHQSAPRDFFSNARSGPLSRDFLTVESGFAQFLSMMFVVGAVGVHNHQAQIRKCNLPRMERRRGEGLVL